MHKVKHNIIVTELSMKRTLILKKRTIYIQFMKCFILQLVVNQERGQRIRLQLNVIKSIEYVMRMNSLEEIVTNPVVDNEAKVTLYILQQAVVGIVTRQVSFYIAFIGSISSFTSYNYCCMFMTTKYMTFFYELSLL